MTQTIEELMKGHRDAITVKKVFGEPFEKNGVTVIPAAKVMGGGGGGAGESPEGGGQGSGSGFGIAAQPAGAYVIRGDEVMWQPAVDVNRIIAGVLLLAALALVRTFRSSK
ncbi:MAG TPA: spore germination protein GerW family protein [Actinomycetota bacterium]|nr:spore germination protein GerW family protein [Actinomycetota bacterium]